MVPRSEPRQTVLAASLDVDPHTWRHDYLDYWGTATTAFESSEPAQLADAHRGEPGRGAPAGRAGAARAGTWCAPTCAVDAMAEFLATSPTTEPPPELARRGARGSAGARARRRTTRRGRSAPRSTEAVEYVPGVTAVHSSGQRRVGRAQGRLPGHGAPVGRRPAQRRHPRPVRVRLPAPRRRRRGRADRDRASRTPGSSGGSGTGSASTRPTTSTSASTTWCSGGAASTTTSRRSGASSPVARHPDAGRAGADHARGVSRPQRAHGAAQADGSQGVSRSAEQAVDGRASPDTRSERRRGRCRPHDQQGEVAGVPCTVAAAGPSGPSRQDRPGATSSTACGSGGSGRGRPGAGSWCRPPRPRCPPTPPRPRRPGRRRRATCRSHRCTRVSCSWRRRQNDAGPGPSRVSAGASGPSIGQRGPQLGSRPRVERDEGRGVARLGAARAGRGRRPGPWPRPTSAPRRGAGRGRRPATARRSARAPRGRRTSRAAANRRWASPSAARWSRLTCAMVGTARRAAGAWPGAGSWDHMGRRICHRAGPT